MREELGQASWFVRENSTREARSHWKKSHRGLVLPGLGLRRRRQDEVWAVTMVRDEADIIELTIRHLLDQGVDHILVADNLSTDDTPQILRRLADHHPNIHLARDNEPAYYQRVKMSMLARAASRAGADWVVPFDSDELWFAGEGSVKEHLVDLGAQDGPTIGAVRALLHDTIPVGGQAPDVRSATCLLDATPTPPGKVAVRAHPLMGIVIGNHGASRVGSVADGLHIAHLQYRSAVQVERKARQGMDAVRQAEVPDWIGAHWKALEEISEEDLPRLWDEMQRGIPQPAIHYYAHGPMVRVHPSSWPHWDPEHVIPAANGWTAP